MSMTYNSVARQNDAVGLANTDEGNAFRRIISIFICHITTI